MMKDYMDYEKYKKSCNQAERHILKLIEETKVNEKVITNANVKKYAKETNKSLEEAEQELKVAFHNVWRAMYKYDD